MIEKWTPDSRAINASAGYGKTEALAVRLLAIFLSDDVAHHVERGDAEYNDAARNTVALTFAKAAAGEIYERMLLLLSQALESEEELRKLRDRFSALVYTDAFSQVTAEELRELLVRLVREMGNLNIATIDSFFYRLIRAYSIELGLPGTVEMLSDGASSVLGGDLIRKLLTGSGTDEKLLENCRMSLYGADQKSFFECCRDLMRDMLKFREHSGDQDFWGGDFIKFTPTPEAERRAAWEFVSNYDWGNLSKGNLEKKKTLLTLLEKCRKADSWEFRFTLAEQSLIREFLGVKGKFYDKTPRGYSQGWHYTPDIVAPIYALIENGRRVLLSQCARRTRALLEVMKGYLDLYRSDVLYRGRLSFSDLPLLLAEKPEDSATQLGFLYEIFYRTNCHFRNFLIDEFQDTSRAQWKVLDFVSESNDEGDHSLFIVGDVKQAIYGWRSGDSKLMGEVVVQRELPEPTDLPCSYRYGTGICEGLNHIFGGENVSGFVRRLGAAGGSIPAGCFKLVGDSWNGAFKPHAADPEKKIPGELSVLALSPNNEIDFAEGAARLIADRLRKIDFFGRRLSGGVLVRDKSSGIKLRNELLKVDPSLEGRIVWEGDEGIAKDPLVASLIAFGIWIQHPSDDRCGGIVGMNQLMSELVSGDFDRMKWATAIAERGIHGFLCEVLASLSARTVSWGNLPASDWDPVNSGDVHALLAIAREFDASGEPRDFLRFGELAAKAQKKAVPIPGKLRLLTIHHSKGLTFDVVFLPMFRPSRGGNWKHLDKLSMTSGKSEERGEWLLRSPREEGLAEADIAEALHLMHADDCLEEMCVLYVALTRARYGMYVYLEPLTDDKRNAYHRDWAKVVDPQRRRPEVLDVPCYMSDFIFSSCFFDPKEPGDGTPVPEEEEKKMLFTVQLPLPVRTLPPPEPKDDSEAAAAEAAGKRVEYLLRSFGEPWNGQREEKKKKPGRAAAPVGALKVDFVDTAPRMTRSTPSRLDENRVLDFRLPGADSGEQLGTRIHAFFSAIGRWREFEAPEDTEKEIMAHYEACGKNPELVRMLDEKCVLWLERPFDVVLEDDSGSKALVSGCFDRVQIYKDDRDGVARALIIDYKSNKVDENSLKRLIEHYRPQLDTYRRALGVLLGISPNLIRCALVFTRIGAVVPV